MTAVSKKAAPLKWGANLKTGPPFVGADGWGVIGYYRAAYRGLVLEVSEHQKFHRHQRHRACRAGWEVTYPDEHAEHADGPIPGNRIDDGGCKTVGAAKRLARKAADDHLAGGASAGQSDR